ncbi:hypothetical protein J7W19_10770 [Streptomyces mobaraensis NBRC 13819 = DSM 40847]|uniref:Uncharacterized protein n=1 Tax=Streptomyces mobaraensis (strain ATCC 29032 / DSM 40847 / JCM 4168 / NBRC 13819 / NCIMB 11159 / IPCR 16-22) TaxID=1223523 RepID=M3C164_STRM1|nr:hypothetical protein [Streptomyces mobaraensis]EME97745.1 hypothetical protein H340_24937 [Streptomyces mobaraensis NBRC 13819 = DSM 40847]QTT73839.1 hypothetical protein J7W19_10770 [Streptomyces mobaraensis NBRC 13819 = DSM 40847]
MTVKLLDPANIPVFTGNLELLESYIGALRKDAARLRTTGSDIHSRFQGLAAHYRAPEAEQLFATTLPVRERAHAFAAKLDKVAGALSDYAAEARPLAHKLAALALEAETFLMSIEGDDRWKHDSKKTDHHNRIRDDITAAQAAFQDAERRCASRITALVGGPRFVTDDGTHKPNMYGYDAETLEHAKLPWGDPVEREYDWYEPHSLKSFAWDGVVVDGIGGTFKGLGTLIGVDGWDRMGQAWAGLGKTAVGAFIYGSGAFAIPDDYLPSFFEDSKKAARDTAKALVAYDEWGKDPARAAGAAGFNILTTATGTGAVAKGGAAAKVVNAVGKAGRLIDPMTYAGKGAGFVLNKSVAKLSSTLPKVGDLVNNLRDRFPGMERLPDGSVRLPNASVLPGRARYLRPDYTLVDIRGRGVRGHAPITRELPAGADSPHGSPHTSAHNAHEREPVMAGADRRNTVPMHVGDSSGPSSHHSNNSSQAAGHIDPQRSGHGADHTGSTGDHSSHGGPHTAGDQMPDAHGHHGQNGPSASMGSGTGHQPSSQATAPQHGPWPVKDSVPGPAAGEELKRPHSRHSPNGAARGEIKEKNSVILQGFADDVDKDIAAIAEGRAKLTADGNRYEINGRTYGVEPGGRVYPDSGPGIAILDRNEYAALQQVAKAKGDISAAPQLTKNPRFVNNPQAVQKALAIYHGTYP